MNVKSGEYGVVANGSDDTAALQIAVYEAAGTAGGLGEVYFPPGTYLVRGLRVPAGTRVRGTLATIKMLPLSEGDGSPVIEVLGPGVTLKGLFIEGSKGDHSHDGFHASFDSGSDSTGRAYRSGIKIDGGYDVSVIGCQIFKTYGAAIAARECQRLKVVDCYSKDCNFEGLYHKVDTASRRGRNLTIRGNLWENCRSGDGSVLSDGCYLEGVDNVEYSDNIITGSENRGLVTSDLTGFGLALSNAEERGYVTLFDHGATIDQEGGTIDVSDALSDAIDDALSRDMFLDLSGGTWRFDTPLNKTGDLKLRNGELRYGGSGSNSALTITGTPAIEDVKLYKIQNTSIKLLAIVGAVRGSLTRCTWDNARNGSCIGLELRGCQGLNFYACNFYDNDQHLSAIDNDLVPCTDLKFFGCLFKGSISTNAAVSLTNVRQPFFSGCGIENSRGAHLLLTGCLYSHFEGMRFEDPGLLVADTYPHINLNSCTLVSFSSCTFSNTNGNTVDMIVDTGPSSLIKFHRCHFSESTDVIASAADWEESMNSGFKPSGSLKYLYV